MSMLLLTGRMLGTTWPKPCTTGNSAGLIDDLGLEPDRNCTLYSVGGIELMLGSTTGPDGKIAVGGKTGRKGTGGETIVTGTDTGGMNGSVAGGMKVRGPCGNVTGGTIDIGLGGRVRGIMAP